MVWLLGGYLYKNLLHLLGKSPLASILLIQNYVKSIFPALNYIARGPAPWIALALGGGGHSTV